MFNLVLNSQQYITNNESNKSYICKIFPKIKKHVVHLLIKNCTCKVMLHVLVLL